MELNHNIGFSIGDYCWDGHCLYQEYHIVSNYSGEDSDEFVDIFFKLVKIKIPDLVWDYRNLNEESVHLLDGAGYGLFSN